jgi:hypothetical protein
MTPWFAAATGFVIAASLWIYSPHPQLTYPAISIGPCKTSGCSPKVDQQGAGSLTIKSGERARQQHKAAAPVRTGPRTRASTAASGLTFGYFVRQTTPGNFELTVSGIGQRAVKNWKLAFVLPGDQIRYVIGAHWQANGRDGIVASPLAGDQGQQHGGPGDYGGGPGDHRDGGAYGQAGDSFEVFASGTRVGPADCSFNGASCTFHELSSASQGGR